MPYTKTIEEECKHEHFSRVCNSCGLDMLLTSHTNLVKEILKVIDDMKCDERKVKDLGEWFARTYEEKMLVNATLSDLKAKLEEMIK